MGQPRKPQPVKLFVGMLSSSLALLEEMISALEKEFGDSDLRSDLWAFDYTDYYEREMGSSLQRLFVSFRELIDPEKLGQIKRRTNDLEQQCAGSRKHCRPVNLDPGYLNLSKVVLATTKDYSHRIYLGSGIYAEVTLHYQKKRYTPLDWTYPDYRTSHYLEFFAELRDIYRRQLPAL